MTTRTLVILVVGVVLAGQVWARAPYSVELADAVSASAPESHERVRLAQAAESAAVERSTKAPAPTQATAEESGAAQAPAARQAGTTRPTEEEGEPAPSPIKALLGHASAAFEAGGYERVIELASRAIDLDPGNVNAYILRGQAYGEGRQDYERAIADLATINRLAPRLADAWGVRGWYLILLGRWRDAQEVTARARALDPNYFAWTINLGHAYLLQGNREQAQYWYRRALTLVPDEASLRSGPLEDFDLFIERGWQVAAARAERDWFVTGWAEWQALEALNADVLDDYRAARYEQGITRAREGLARAERLLGSAHPEVAKRLNNLAALLRITGQYAEAEPLYRRALAIDEQTKGPDHQDVARDHNNLAVLLRTTGRYAEAEPLYRQALAIYEQVRGPDHPDVASALNNLAFLLRTIGRTAEAEPLYRRALAIDEQALGPEHPNVATDLNNLAVLLRTTGRYGEAEPLHRRALTIREASLGPIHPDVAQSLNDLAELLRTTGRYAEAEPLYRRAVAIDEQAYGPDHLDVAADLNNLALLLRTTGRYAEAEPLYRRALAIDEQALGSKHPDVATDINNLAGLLHATGRYAKAEPLYRQALSIIEQAGGPAHPLVAGGLNNLAELLRTTGRANEAEPLYERALAIADGAGVPEALWSVQGNVATLYRDQNQRPLAIFFGKQAVNTLQAVRQNLAAAEQTTQQVFLKTQESYYKELADLLIRAGRFAEAQQVLDMLKESELYDYLQEPGAEDPRRTLATPNAFENERAGEYRAVADRLAALGRELAPLIRILPEVRTPEKRDRIAALEAKREALAAELDQTLSAIKTAFAELAPERQAALTAEMNQMAGNKRERVRALSAASGSPTALLQYLVLDDKVDLLLTTPEQWIARESGIERARLNEEIDTLRQALDRPGPDPRPAAETLYRLLVAPMEPDLEAAGTRALLVQLDGRLRYLPFAALYDGEQYLVERYPLTVYTAASERTEASTAGSWRVAGLGTTRAYPGFTALPAVTSELEGIVRQGPNDPDGVLPGTVHLDGDFTEAELRAEAADSGNSVLHLATHFELRPGNDTQSSLLLGTGERLSLRRLREGQLDLRHIDLFTLSACDTALGGANAEGAEIEGLGSVVQRQGAKGVIATLWPVADTSTGALMQTLYRLRRDHPELTKAETLRQAQLALMGGTAAGGTGQRGPRGVDLDRPPESAPQDTDSTERRYAHPYYWAPFILMGNWL